MAVNASNKFLVVLWQTSRNPLLSIETQYLIYLHTGTYSLSISKWPSTIYLVYYCKFKTIFLSEKTACTLKAAYNWYVPHLLLMYPSALRPVAFLSSFTLLVCQSLHAPCRRLFHPVCLRQCGFLWFLHACPSVFMQNRFHAFPTFSPQYCNVQCFAKNEIQTKIFSFFLIFAWNIQYFWLICLHVWGILKGRTKRHAIQRG